MKEEASTDPKHSIRQFKGMSLYAMSADYERRMSEDCVQSVEPQSDEEATSDDE